MRGRRVRPCVAKRAEACVLLGDLREDVQKVARRSRQPVKARDHKHVVGGDLGERAAQQCPLGLRTASCLPENLPGSSGAQLLHLRVDALAVGRDSCVAVNHAGRVREHGKFCNNLLHGGKA